MKIWIDADACPKMIKEVIFKTAMRRQIPVVLVANSQMHTPHHSLISLVVVAKGDDVADNHIAEEFKSGDLVITADIPLAARIVEQEGIAINPRGEVYTEDNVSERLSMRDFFKELRDEGMITGGPAPISSKDKQLFTNALDRMITKLLANP